MNSKHSKNVMFMFLMAKIFGFDVLLNNLTIVKISGGHLGCHLELQLFGPYLKLTSKFFKTSLGSPIMIKSLNEETYFAHRTTLSSCTICGSYSSNLVHVNKFCESQRRFPQFWVCGSFVRAEFVSRT